jgi:hypothetical protein
MKSKSRISKRDKDSAKSLPYNVAFFSKATAPRVFGFLTNHGFALLSIARDPSLGMRDIAAKLQIIERAAQRIGANPIGAGCPDRERVVRGNRYTIRDTLPISLPCRR